jgi:hypothetical protein
MLVGMIAESVVPSVVVEIRPLASNVICIVLALGPLPNSKMVFPEGDAIFGFTHVEMDIPVDIAAKLPIVID